MTDAPATEDEDERIRQVYAGYAADEGTARRWDADQPGNVAMIAERRRIHASRLPPPPARAGLEVLDIGCGRGDELAWLAELGVAPAGLHGIDLVAARIDDAHASHPELAPQLDLRVANATALPHDDDAFDVVLLLTVLSSVLDPEMRDAIAREAARVLRPGGLVLWYDFRVPSPGNRNVAPVTRGELRDRFPGFRHDLVGATLAPPLARRLGPSTPRWYPRLARAPFLRTHLAGALVNPR